MTIDEVLYLIHQNGVGQNIECSFISRGIDNKECISSISNYKYQKGIIKIYMGNYHVKMHERNLTRSPYCEFRIKEKGNKNDSILRLICKSGAIEDKFIHASVLNVKYMDDDGKEISHRIISN